MSRRKHFPSQIELLQVATHFSKKAGKEGLASALLGGLAMQLYGSDRFTKDVDFVADGMIPGEKVKRSLTFGGGTYIGRKNIEIDWIVRSDALRELYDEALHSARDALDGPFRIVLPHYLAVIKLAARRQKDYDDLMQLLEEENLVDTEKALEVADRLLGAYAAEDLSAAISEAEWRRRQGEE